jgi:hypothetical protein
MSIREVALSKKGTFATIAYSRPVKTVKTCPVQIMKTTVARNVRIGVQYDAIKSVQLAKGVSNTKEAHAVNEGLRGFEWDVYPTLLKSVKTGDKYVRIATNSNTRFDTKYTVDGREVNKADIEQYLYSSEKSHGGDLPAVLNINLNTISYIH